MSSRIRNALNAGIAAVMIGAAVLTLAPTPAAAFSLGGLGHFGGFGHVGGLGHMGGGFGRMGGVSHLNGFGHTASLGHISVGQNFGDAVHVTHTTPNLHQSISDRIVFGKSDSIVKGDRGTIKTFEFRGTPSRGDFGREHGYVLIAGLLIPGPGPVFADDVPVPPTRPVIADGPNKPGEVVVAEGPKADTPDLIVEVKKPCPGAILLVSPATSACVNGVVQISGDEYYYLLPLEERVRGASL
jgi:hypothetical protein